ncbi:MAG: LytTR family transcriptional regulator [Flavobacteriaceae bacterium]|nr:LytTR family transcriptional regulator [Flavobacteriaceae bacterium]
MEKKLPQSIFFRVSRTSIVNVTAIRTIHRNVQYTLTLTNGYRIQIPRTGYKLLISFMEKNISNNHITFLLPEASVFL